MSRGVKKPVIRLELKMKKSALRELVGLGAVRQYQGPFILAADEDADGRARFEAAIDAENESAKERVRAVLAELIGDARRLLRRMGIELGWEALGDLHAAMLDGAEVLVDFGELVRGWAQEAYDECELRGKMQVPVFRAIGAAGLRALIPDADAVVEVTGDGVAVTRVPGGAKAVITYAPVRLVFGAELLVALERSEAQRRAK